MDKAKQFELLFDRHVLEALLVHGAAGKDLRLPTKAKFVLSEVVNGYLSYLGSNLVGRVLWLQYPYPDHDPRSFARNLHELLESVEKPKDRVGAAILALAKPEQMHSPPGRPYVTTELEDTYSGPIAPIRTATGGSSWSLPTDLVRRVRRDVMPKFSDAEQLIIKEIGEAMQPFVHIDLQHITKTYSY